MNIEEMKEKVKGFQDEIEEIRKSLLSKEEREKKIKDVQERARKAKEEFEEMISNMKENVRDSFEVVRESLNGIINTKLSILDNLSGDGGTPSDNTSGTELSSGAEKKGFFEKIKDNLKSITENFKKNPGTTLLHGLGFGVAGLGIFALAYKGVKEGVKKVKNLLFSGEEQETQQRTQEERDEGTEEGTQGGTQESSQEGEGERLEQGSGQKDSKAKTKKKESFWNKWYGKVLKWTGIIGGSFMLGRLSNGGKTDNGEAGKTDSSESSKKGDSSESSKKGDSSESLKKGDSSESSKKGDSSESSKKKR